MLALNIVKEQLGMRCSRQRAKLMATRMHGWHGLSLAFAPPWGRGAALAALQPDRVTALGTADMKVRRAQAKRAPQGANGRPSRGVNSWISTAHRRRWLP